MRRAEWALNAFTHLQVLGKTFPLNPHAQDIHLTLSLAFWKENSQPVIEDEKNWEKNPYWHIKLNMFAGPPETAITLLQPLWTDYSRKHWLLPGNSTC